MAILVAGGEFLISMLVGALISVATNGIVNSINDRPFFEGAGRAALIGAIGGGLANGIGTITQGIQNGVAQVAARGIMHAYAGGFMSAFSGGDFLQGMASGFVGAIIGGGTQGLLKNASKFVRDTATIASAGLAGGITSELSGGEFWDGARNGLISASLNHVAHGIRQEINRRALIAKIAKKYENSKEWAKNVSKDNFGAGTYKCNKFVYDVLKEAGASPGTPNGNRLARLFGGEGTSPPTASQWADPDYDIPDWNLVDSPQAGDVVSVRGDFVGATGHVGIMIGPSQSIGANSTTVRISNFGHSSYSLTNYPNNKGYIYRRYNGN